MKSWRLSAARAAIVICLSVGAMAGFLAAAIPSAAVPVQNDEGPQLPPSQSDSSTAPDRARQILSGDEYKQRAEQQTIVERIRRWIGDRLPKLPSGASSQTVPKWVSFLVVGVLATLAIGALALGLIHTRRTRRGKKSSEDDDGSADVELTPLLSVDEWLVEALRLAEAGHWRGALRAQYRSLVGTMTERELLADIPGRTPAEHRLDVLITSPDVAQDFTQLTAMFEQAWFGDKQTKADDVERFVQLADQVRRLAPRKPVAIVEEILEPAL